jgi:hypothetical protein
MKKSFMIVFLLLGIYRVSYGSNQKGETSHPIYGHKFIYE